MAVNTAEEDRLWTMVRANCLDFNAWTALIEETEKVSEVFVILVSLILGICSLQYHSPFGFFN